MIVNSESSEDEGFYKPTIQITPGSRQEKEVGQSCNFEGGLEILTQGRPIDFLPRVLNTEPQYFQNKKVLDDSNESLQGQLMQALPVRNTNESAEQKKKRFASLQAKYSNNPNFELVYSKIPHNKQFSTYFFSLESTPDYNHNNFTPITNQLQPEEHPQEPIETDKTLTFDSRFESGNLLYSYRKKKSELQHEYDLIIQNDTNTKGYNQWFYFSVSNTSCMTAKLNIVNFIKKKHMFLDGVRPVAFSLKKNQNENCHWFFIGNNISYQKSYITREAQKAGTTEYKNYYSLSMQINFQFEDDVTFIALNFPYTYSRMVRHIDSLQAKCPSTIQIHKKVLCHSISNNPIPYLIISNKQNAANSKILCLARQHPGQTVGSFVLQNFINQIITKDQILKHFTFVIVPMVNVDGVIYGNFRTNLAGFDLNRQWNAPNKWLHPEVFYLSKLISSLSNIEFCMDFHGHSKKLNSFIYSCLNEKVSDFRIYPYIYSKKCELFSIADCTFSITPDKVKTARVNVYQEVKKPYIFTLETSFFGHTRTGKPQRFCLSDFQVISKGAIESLQTLLIHKSETSKFLDEVKEKGYLFEQWAIQNKEDYGSESNPSEDELNVVERKAKVMSDVKSAKFIKRSQKINSKLSRKNEKTQKRKRDLIQISGKVKMENRAIFEKKKSDTVLRIQTKSKQKQTEFMSLIQDDKYNKIREEIKLQSQKNNIEPKLNSAALANVHKPQQIKVSGSNALTKPQRILNSTNVSSNLFDPTSYSKMREQISIQLKKNEQQNVELLNRRREINSLHGTITPPLESRFSRVRAEKLKKQFEELAPIYSQPKRKSREKVYIIKENKVIRSFTRVNQGAARLNLQKQISCRTMTVKNCQRIIGSLTSKGIQQPNYLQEEIQEQDPYKTKKLLRPLDIRKHSNFKEEKGVFFSFI